MSNRLTRRAMLQRRWLRSFTILATGSLAAGFATAASAEEVAATAAAAATAQPEAAQPAAPAPGDEDIVVTGIRASLRNAANAKRDNIGFSESVAAGPMAHRFQDEPKCR